MTPTQEAMLNAAVVLLESTLGDMPASEADDLVRQCIDMIKAQLKQPVEHKLPPKPDRTPKRGCYGDSVENGIVCYGHAYD